MGQNALGANNQMTQFAVVMFGSIVSSVAVSTVIIMSLLGGPVTGALTTQNNSSQTGAGAQMCVANPAEVADDEAVAAAGAGHGTFAGSPAKLAGKGQLLGGMSGSFNTTNSNSTTTHTTTNNHFTNTETKTIVTIRDNGNTVNSGNTNVQAWNNGNDNSHHNHQSSTTTNTVVTVQDNSNNQTWHHENNSVNTVVDVSNNGNDYSDNSNQNNNSGVIISDNEVEIDLLWVPL